MESKLEGRVNYLQFVVCTLDAAKSNDELYRTAWSPQMKDEAYLILSIGQ